MKKVKFTKYEKIAGLFVVGTFGVLVATFAVLALQQGWLKPKVHLQTELAAADGIRKGTSVHMAGLKVGVVSQVQLKSQGGVRVHFKVQQDYFDKIRADSVVTSTRPFVIGEKILEISVGSESSPQRIAGSLLPFEASLDMLDLLNGGKVGSLFENMSSALENLSYLVEAFSDRQRTEDFVEIYDQVKPLVKNLSQMAQETHWLVLHLNKKDRMVRLVDELKQTSHHVNSALPQMLEGDLIQKMTQLADNLNTITEELAEFVPVMKEFGPEMPQVGRRAIEALDETVVTLKAMQQSFMLRGATKKVRDQEKEARAPADESTDSNAP